MHLKKGKKIIMEKPVKTVQNKTNPDKNRFRIGVISDTHGLLRPGVARIFSNIDRILHAGDVGGFSVMEELQKIAPVTAVRGNMDGGEWAQGLPPFEAVSIGGLNIYVLHDLYDLDIAPSADGFSVVINGHTHRPAIRSQKGVLYLNPGSAGPKRSGKPVSVGLLHIENGRAEAEIIEIEP